MNKSKGLRKKIISGVFIIVGLVVIVMVWEVIRTLGRAQIQVNIHQNQELIYLSTFAEPPQFAIWLEDKESSELSTIFVTHRVATGDWEGKADVPVALPRWHELFIKGQSNADTDAEPPMAVTGATPKEDYFSIRAEVKPESEWICWVEMNLAGDFNEAFPEQNIENMEFDEFSNGQPSLLFRCELIATEGSTYKFDLVSQAIWKDGETTLEPVSEGVTTARDVFDEIFIEVIRPKPKLIDKNKIENL